MKNKMKNEYICLGMFDRPKSDKEKQEEKERAAKEKEKDEKKAKFNREDKTFRLPIEMNIPVEVENKINKQVEDETLYEAAKEKK